MVTVHCARNASDQIRFVLNDIGTVDINEEFGRVLIETETAPSNVTKNN